MGLQQIRLTRHEKLLAYGGKWFVMGLRQHSKNNWVVPHPPFRYTQQTPSNLLTRYVLQSPSRYMTINVIFLSSDLRPDRHGFAKISHVFNDVSICNVWKNIITRLEIFAESQTQGSFFSMCDIRSCIRLSETNSCGLDVFLLSCVVSELRKPPSPGFEHRIIFRGRVLCFCSTLFIELRKLFPDFWPLYYLFIVSRNKCAKFGENRLYRFSRYNGINTWTTNFDFTYLVLVQGSFSFKRLTNGVNGTSFYYLRTCNRVLLEKLIVAQIARELPAFCRIKCFIIVFWASRLSSLI